MCKTIKFDSLFRILSCCPSLVSLVPAFSLRWSRDPCWLLGQDGIFKVIVVVVIVIIISIILNDKIYFFLLDICFIYISNNFPFPRSSPESPISRLPSPCSPIEPSHYSVLVFPYTTASSLSRTRGLSFLWGPKMLSSASYVSGAMHNTMCTIWLMFLSLGALGVLGSSYPTYVGYVPPMVLLRRGNKIFTKCGAQYERKTIQRLPHLGIHPIYTYKM